MGLFKRFKHVADPPSLVASIAVKQYHNAKYPNMEEIGNEIPQALWLWRYANANLDAKSFERLTHYLDSDFDIITMMDFCLSTIDIEYLIGPPDTKTYYEDAEYITSELNKNGVPSFSNGVFSFVERWNEKILPFRKDNYSQSELEYYLNSKYGISPQAWEKLDSCFAGSTTEGTPRSFSPRIQEIREVILQGREEDDLPPHDFELLRKVEELESSEA